MLRVTREGNYVDEIRIPDWTRQLIEAHTADRRTGPVLLTKGRATTKNPYGARKRLGRTQASELVTNWARKAGIGQPVTAHAARHGVAIHLLEQGAAITDIQALFGHASPVTTQRYTRVVDTRKLRLAETMADGLGHATASPSGRSVS